MLVVQKLSFRCTSDVVTSVQAAMLLEGFSRARRCDEVIFQEAKAALAEIANWLEEIQVGMIFRQQLHKQLFKSKNL